MKHLHIEEDARILQKKEPVLDPKVNYMDERNNQKKIAKIEGLRKGLLAKIMQVRGQEEESDLVQL